MSLSDPSSPCPAAAAFNARLQRLAHLATAAPAGAGSARCSAWGRRGCHLCCAWLPVRRSPSALLRTKSLALPDDAAPSNQGRSSTVQAAALHHTPARARRNGWLALRAAGARARRWRCYAAFSTSTSWPAKRASWRGFRHTCRRKHAPTLNGKRLAGCCALRRRVFPCQGLSGARSSSYAGYAELVSIAKVTPEQKPGESLRIRSTLQHHARTRVSSRVLRFDP